MKIYEKDTHEAKYLYVENEEQFNPLEGHLIENIDNHYILRPAAPVTEEGMFCFNVTSCDPFSSYLVNRKLSRPELVSLLAQLKSVITTLEDHMLSDANVLLEPEHMYIDKNNRKVRFVPVCGREGTFSVRLRKLTEALFMHADLEDTESLRLAAGMMRISLNEDVRMHDLMQLVETRRTEAPVRAERENSRTDSAGERREYSLEAEQYHGSSVICTHPQEERTMRLSDAEQKACRSMDTEPEDSVTVKEKTGGLRGLLRSMTAGLRERMEEDES